MKKMIKSLISFLLLLTNLNGAISECTTETPGDYYFVLTPEVKFLKNISEVTITCSDIPSLLSYNYTFDDLDVNQTLEVTNATISEFPKLPHFSGINKLKFRNFHFDSIKPDAFKDLPKLKYLNFQYKLTKIPNLSQFGIDRLKSINLGGNKLSKIDKFLNAEEILLQNNQIETITVPFQDVYKLDMHRNKLKIVKNSFFKTPETLKFLSLSGNGMSTIDNGPFINMSNLEDLQLDDNEITAIKRDVFRDLKNLKILNLSDNKIKNLELGLFNNLINLEILDLSHNVINFLYEELLHPLVNLEKLWLNDNHINWLEIREIKRHNRNLTVINLVRNKWICGDLDFIIKHLEIQNITLYEDDRGSSYPLIEGAPCTYQDKRYPQCTNLWRQLY